MTAAAYDFIRAWPLPRDAELHRAGRQGILDQKEDEDLSDQEWLGIQHGAYAQEWNGCMVALVGLSADRNAITQGHRSFRSEEARTAALAAICKERTELRNRLAGLMNEYESHYGHPAHTAFNLFLACGWCARTSHQPLFDENGQALLF